MLRCLQANVNKSKAALDLLLHYAKETKSEILIVSEPNYIPATSNWFSSKDGNAAIFIDPNYSRDICDIAGASSRFIAMYYGSYLIISLYAAPSLNLREFNNILDELSEVISHRVNKIILAGDFNAKASLWGSSLTDKRGRLLTR